MPFLVPVGEDDAVHLERGPFNCDDNTWGLAPETELSISGHRDGARHLCGGLLEAGFDVAYAYETRHPSGLAHSFNNTVVFLDYDRAGFPYPIVPFHVNCYGNQLMSGAAGAIGEGSPEISPPSPAPARCFAIGRATARILAAGPWRVALIASSSWSHASLTAKHDRLYPDLAADRARHGELVDGGFTAWGDIDLGAIDDAGQNEFLNWICLAGAMTETGQTFEPVDFIESHLFNSSKCFGTFPPIERAP